MVFMDTQLTAGGQLLFFLGNVGLNWYSGHPASLWGEHGGAGRFISLFFWGLVDDISTSSHNMKRWYTPNGPKRVGPQSVATDGDRWPQP